MAKKKIEHITRTQYYNRVIDDQSTPPLPVSDIRAIKQTILNAVTGLNSVELFKQLTETFTYEPYKKNGERSGGLGFLHYYDTYDLHYQRPVIEHLFFEDKGVLTDIVAEIIKANNQDLFKAFKCALRHKDVTDLNETMLFSLNRKTVNASLKRLDEYGLGLGGGETTKREAILNITAKFGSIKWDAPITTETNQDQFKMLKSKLDMYQSLHANDETLNKHRDTRLLRLIGDVVAWLFSACLAWAPHVYHKHKSGDWTFFNGKTASATKVCEVEKDLFSPVAPTA